MSPAPFTFSLDFSSQGVPAQLLEELAGQVFRFVGCTAAPAGDLAVALTKATAAGAYGATRCDLQVRAHNPTLEILVSANGGRVWQGSCAISPSAGD